MSHTERAWATLELVEAAAARREAIERHRQAVIEAVRAGVPQRHVALMGDVSHVTVAKWWRQRP